MVLEFLFLFVSSCKLVTAALLLFEDSKDSREGRYSDKSEATLTQIGIHALINLAEEIVSYRIEELENDNLELRISVDEIKACFTIIS